MRKCIDKAMLTLFHSVSGRYNLLHYNVLKKFRRESILVRQLP